MKISRYEEVQIRKHWFVVWYDFRSLGVAIHIDRYSARVSLLFFGVEIEWLDKEESETQV